MNRGEGSISKKKRNPPCGGTFGKTGRKEKSKSTRTKFPPKERGKKKRDGRDGLMKKARSGEGVGGIGNFRGQQWKKGKR